MIFFQICDDFVSYRLVLFINCGSIFMFLAVSGSDLDFSYSDSEGRSVKCAIPFGDPPPSVYRPCSSWFWIFLKLKMPLKRPRFLSKDEITKKTVVEFNTIPKESSRSVFACGKNGWSRKKFSTKLVTPLT